MAYVFVPERAIVVRKEAKTNPAYGYEPDKLPVKKLLNYGIVNLDKPKGPTSHEVTDYVKQILNVKKAGHSGTLDPGVTGVLPIAIGRATRIVQFLLTAGKEYVGIMHLHKEVSREELEKALKEMTGKIKQLPPVKSAVKRELRERDVYYARINEIKGKDVLFTIGCQAGTYIRKWVHDLGVRLKVGAHMAELRRTKAGPFTEDDAVTLQQLSDNLHFYKETGNEELVRAVIQPIERGVEHLPKIWVFDSTVNTICHGANLAVPGIAKLNEAIKPGNIVAVMTLKNELIAIGKSLLSTEEMISDEKNLAVDVSKVFMEPETYPSLKPKQKTSQQ